MCFVLLDILKIYQTRFLDKKGHEKKTHENGQERALFKLAEIIYKYIKVAHYVYLITTMLNVYNNLEYVGYGLLI